MLGQASRHLYFFFFFFFFFFVFFFYHNNRTRAPFGDSNPPAPCQYHLSSELNTSIYSHLLHNRCYASASMRPHLWYDATPGRMALLTIPEWISKSSFDFSQLPVRWTAGWRLEAGSQAAPRQIALRGSPTHFFPLGGFLYTSCISQ
jgi:hypothetical protein